jgi:hypothetical protein
MRTTVGEIKHVVRAALCEAADLSPELGTVGVTKKMVLAHNTDKPFKGKPQIVTSRDRLIPNSFSLGRSGPTSWGFFGGTRLHFRLSPGVPMLAIDRNQFYSWGEETDTPLSRGKAIETWARQNGIKVIKLKLAPIQDLEYAVLDTDVLERVEANDR